MKRPLNSTAELLHCLLFLKKSGVDEPELILLLEKATRASVAAGAQQLGIGSLLKYGRQANSKLASICVCENHDAWRSEAIDLLASCCLNVLQHEGGKLDGPNRLICPHYSEIPEVELAAALARAFYLVQMKPDDETLIAAGYYLLKGWGEFFTPEACELICQSVFDCLSRSASAQDDPNKWIAEIKLAALVLMDESAI